MVKWRPVPLSLHLINEPRYLGERGAPLVIKTVFIEFAHDRIVLRNIRDTVDCFASNNCIK